MTRRISVNMGGLWRTSVELKEDATWMDLRMEIGKVTGIIACFQKLEPCGDNNKKCELEEGDDVFCDWKLSHGTHPLHNAAYYGNIEAIHSWLASGADINVANIFKRIPLLNACDNLKEKCVMELLRLGANVNVIDSDGETGLHYIANAHYSNLEKMERIAKILIKAGCNPTICNKNGETFIDILKRRYHNKLTKKSEEWLKEME